MPRNCARTYEVSIISPTALSPWGEANVCSSTQDTEVERLNISRLGYLLVGKIDTARFASPLGTAQLLLSICPGYPHLDTRIKFRRSAVVSEHLGEWTRSLSLIVI